LNVEIIRVNWHGPFSFYDDVHEGDTGPLECYRTWNRIGESGVYLWTYRVNGQYLVNYPGKAKRKEGFLKRLSEGFEHSRAGNNPPVDCVQFLKGIRVPLEVAPPPAERRACLDRIMRGCRLFMAPLDGDDRLVRRVESTIIRHLWSTCELSRRFLWRSKARAKPTASASPQQPRLSLAMTFPAESTICGLEERIEERDWHEYG
jgi:hypothetical protein